MENIIRELNLDKKKFRKKEEEASRNISKILNPKNKYEREKEKMLRKIFGD